MSPYIRVNTNRVLYVTTYHGAAGEKSSHGGLIQQLSNGDTVDIHGGGYQHLMGAQYTVFGIFKIH